MGSISWWEGTVSPTINRQIVKNPTTTSEKNTRFLLINTFSNKEFCTQRNRTTVLSEKDYGIFQKRDKFKDTHWN